MYVPTIVACFMIAGSLALAFGAVRLYRWYRALPRKLRPDEFMEQLLSDKPPEMRVDLVAWNDLHKKRPEAGTPTYRFTYTTASQKTFTTLLSLRSSSMSSDDRRYRQLSEKIQWPGRRPRPGQLADLGKVEFPAKVARLVPTVQAAPKAA